MHSRLSHINTQTEDLSNVFSPLSSNSSLVAQSLFACLSIQTMFMLEIRRAICLNERKRAIDERERGIEIEKRNETIEKTSASRQQPNSGETFAVCMHCVSLAFCSLAEPELICVFASLFAIVIAANNVNLVTHRDVYHGIRIYTCSREKN